MVKSIVKKWHTGRGMSEPTQPDHHKPCIYAPFANLAKRHLLFSNISHSCHFGEQWSNYIFFLVVYHITSDN